MEGRCIIVDDPWTSPTFRPDPKTSSSSPRLPPLTCSSGGHRDMSDAPAQGVVE